MAVVAVSFAAYGGQSLTRVWTLKKEVESLEREVGALRAETARLTADVDRLRTDPDYIEQIARESSGWSSPAIACSSCRRLGNTLDYRGPMDALLPILFVVALVLNVRASFKLGLDWRGMLTTVRFVRNAYARRSALPTEEALERCARLLHLPAFQEPDIAGTVRALCASRYPHPGFHVVVVTKEDEERAPHPAMGVSTGELVRRLRDTLPPYQQKRLTGHGPGRKAHQLNWGSPEARRSWATRSVARSRRRDAD
jgi:hypothetical protein